MQRCPTCNGCYEDEDISCGFQGHKPLVKDRSGSRIIADKYRLERLLGRGGMGAVYVAIQIKLGRLTALKLLQMDFILEGGKHLYPELRDNPEALDQYRHDIVRRFEREAYAAAQLNHPNVVHVYEYDLLNDDEAYICMELIHGPTLQEYLSSVTSHKLPVNVALAITRQVASGINASHSKGITHRDLKPANILLTANEENRLLIKVVDFGLAQLKEKAASESCLTAPGVIIGTAGYMSPEQCQGQEVDARSDIYSLGVILFEMLAGQRPFQSHSPTALALMQVLESAPSLEAYRPDVPPEIVRLVESALEKDPALRPQTMSDFLNRLPEERHPAAAPPLPEGVAARPPTLIRASRESISQNDDYETVVNNRRLEDVDSEVTRALGRDFDPAGKTRVDYATEVADSTELVDKIESLRVSGAAAGEPEAAPPGSDESALGADTRGIVRSEETVDWAKKKNRAKPFPVKPSLYLCLLIALGLIAYATVFTVLPWYYSRAGDMNLRKADYAGAIDAYTKALQFEASDPNIFKERGDAYLRSNDLDSALADYERAIKLNKDDPDAYVRRGLLFERKRDYQRAIDDYTEAVRLGRTADSFLKRGNLFNQLNRYDEAIADYSEALKMNPAGYEAYFGRGSAYLGKGLYGRSLQDLNEAIRLSPNRSDYFNNRGNANAGLKDFDRAMADYEQAIRLDPENAKAYGNRGNVYFELGDYEQALVSYNKALQLAPLANVYQSRAVLYDKLGKSDLAQSDFLRARQLQPSPR